MNYLSASKMRRPVDVLSMRFSALIGIPVGKIAPGNRFVLFHLIKKAAYVITGFFLRLSFLKICVK